MTYLEMVQEAMKRAKVRAGVPTTLTGVVDAALSFKEYVQDSWRELQEESTNWWFRQKLDQTLDVTPGTLSASLMAANNIYGSGSWIYSFGSSWSASGGVATNDGSNVADASAQYSLSSLVGSQKYYLQLDVDITGLGLVTITLGGTEAGTVNLANEGTRSFTVTTTSSFSDALHKYLKITASAGTVCTVSNVFVVPMSNNGSGDQYTIDADLETLNYRTCSIYTTAKQDETPLTLMEYEYWRTIKDTVESSEGRPEYIVNRPDDVIQLWPVPDNFYTLRYDGVWDVDEMTDDADTPGSNISGGTLLPARYHWILIYDACRRFYEDHEDAEGLQKMQSKYLAQRARLSEKMSGPVYVQPGALTGLSPMPRRLR